MCLGSPAPSASAFPPMSPPAAPPAPDPVPTPVSPEIKKARDEQKKRAAAMAGYASTIATSGQGDLTPVSTTAGKTMLGA